jgi:putative drug exporter of the RND superfamily
VEAVVDASGTSLHPRLAGFIGGLLRHRAWVVTVWVAIFAVTLPLAGRLPSVVEGGADPIPGSETGAVIRGVERGFGPGSYYSAPVVVRHATLTTDDPRFADGVRTIAVALGGVPGVRRVESAWTGAGPALIGRDHHTALLIVTPSVTRYAAAEELTGLLRAALTHRTPAGFTTAVTGTTAMLYDVDRRSSTDLAAAERIGLPITLVILLVVFRAPLAALLPVVLALLAVTACNALLVLIARQVPVSVFAENVASMIGLGVGIDYALFVLSRWRRELARGLSPRDAAREAAAATGGAVMFSALAVAVGFLALGLVDAPFLRAITASGVCVVTVAALAAVTLLPVVLATLGRALVWPGRLTATAGRRVAARVSGGIESPGGGWAAWARLVMKRPWVSLAGAGAIVIAVALSSSQMRGWNVGIAELTPGDEARRGYDLLASEFAPGWMGPTVLLVTADRGTLTEPARLDAFRVLTTRLERDRRVAAVHGVSDVARALAAWPASLPLPTGALAPAASVLAPDGRSGIVAVIGRDEPSSPVAGALVRDLRGQGFPEMRAAGLTVLVGGPAAGFVDFDRALFDRLPRVVGAVLILTFLVLALSFRSLVLPLKAIALNLLSVLAAFGFLVLTFQHGVLQHVLGVTPTGGINAFVVLMLFTILFGLSMDYEVFVLARIRDAWRETHDTRRAVERGIAETAGVITSAALIMISIFTAFGFSRLAATRQFGLGLAFAVALDATLLRVVMVPALIVLAGRANWWWPTLTRRLAPDPVPTLPPDGFGGVRDGAVSTSGEPRS